MKVTKLPDRTYQAVHTLAASWMTPNATGADYLNCFSRALLIVMGARDLAQRGHYPDIGGGAPFVIGVDDSFGFGMVTEDDIDLDE